MIGHARDAAYVLAGQELLIALVARIGGLLLRLGNWVGDGDGGDGRKDDDGKLHCCVVDEV